MRKIFNYLVILQFYTTAWAQSTIELSELVPDTFLYSIIVNFLSKENSSSQVIFLNDQIIITNPTSTNRMGGWLVNEYSIQDWSAGSWLNDSSEVYAYYQNNFTIGYTLFRMCSG